MKTKIFLFLFELGWIVKFNVVGMVSLSEIFLLAGAPLFLKANLFVDSDMRRLARLYAALLVAQVVSEFFVSNGLSSSMKGIAITIVSFLHTCFLIKFIAVDKSLIVIMLFGRIVGRIILGPAYDAEGDVMSAMNGESAVWLKFYFASLLKDGLLILAMLYARKNICTLFIVAGFAVVIAGARSGGLLIAVIGIVVYVVNNNIKFAKSHLLIVSLSLCILGYAIYAFYVSMVLSGELSAGNNSQLLECNNPYNPIELLVRGRSEFFVGLVAFSDAPLFGHGAWAVDNTLVYANMIVELHGQDAIYFLGKDFFVPAHSVLVGHGVWNGIFAFGVSLSIFVFLLKTGIKALSKVELKYQFILVACLSDLIWNYLFSPQSHFREGLPFAFAIIMVLWLDTRQDTVIQK